MLSRWHRAPAFAKATAGKAGHQPSPRLRLAKQGTGKEEAKFEPPSLKLRRLKGESLLARASEAKRGNW